MTADNPDGWKLEELLPQIAAELEAKTRRLESNVDPVAVAVCRNNREIINLLKMAEGTQRATLDALAAIGPDQGPRGKPRLGPGPDGGAPAIHTDKVTRFVDAMKPKT